jgi:broad specificity phosphatase PhoE
MVVLLQQGRSAAELAPMYQQALDAGLAALQEEVAAAAAAASGEDSDSTAADSSSWGALVQALEPIKVGGNWGRSSCRCDFYHFRFAV